MTKNDDQLDVLSGLAMFRPNSEEDAPQEIFERRPVVNKSAKLLIDEINSEASEDRSQSIPADANRPRERQQVRA